MSAIPIINARDRLSWHQRLVSDASTVFMWGVFLKLWYPLLGLLAWPTHAHAATHHAVRASAHLLPTMHRGDVRIYAVALITTSVMLLLWNRLPPYKERTLEAHSTLDEARHFDVPVEEILAGRAASVCIVHHDERGRIVRVEPKAA